MTPPLDEEVEDNESREIEAKARKTLETEGCPLATQHISKFPCESRPRSTRR